MTADILAQIDAVTAPVCGWCQTRLLPDGPSPDFCDDECQYEWQRLRGERLTRYQEPTDLAAHVYNQVEQANPETTPQRRLPFTGLTLDELFRQLRPTRRPDALAGPRWWQPPADVVEVRVEHDPVDTVCTFGGEFQLPIRPRWFVRGAGRPEEEVPPEIVAAATPLRLLRRPDLPPDDLLRENVQQIVHQFAEAAERVRPQPEPSAGGTLPPPRAAVGDEVVVAFDGSSNDAAPIIGRYIDGVFHLDPPPSPASQLFLRPNCVARIQADVTRFAEALAPIGDAFRQINDSLTPVVHYLRDSGVLPVETPTDPRERALHLRRNRNTGPQGQCRAPRAINPRGGR